MTLQELTTFDRVFLDYLDKNDHDEDARDLYLTTMETHTAHLAFQDLSQEIIDYGHSSIGSFH